MTYEDGEETYEVTSGDRETARRIYRAAVEAHRDSDTNVDEIHEDFEEGIRRAYKNGDIVVRTERLLVAYLWTLVSSESGRNCRRFVEELVDGRTALISPDEWLNTVITCGRQRRTMIRHMVHPDWGRIIGIREDNNESSTKALKDAKAASVIGLAILDKHGSMEAAADDDDLPIRFGDAS